MLTATCFAVAVGTILSYILGLLIGSPWLLPFLNTAVAYVVMVRAIRRGAISHAIRAMWVWALALAVGGTALSWSGADPALVLNGAAYWEEMHAWLQTGTGREADPAAFIPQHVLHVAAFTTITLVSGGLFGMPLGAALMNYMGYYVARVAGDASSPAAAAVLAWHPWAVLRVASFVILGVLFSAPLLARLLRFPFDLLEHRRWLYVAAAGLLLDVVLKWSLAGSWRQLLLAVTQ